MPGWGWVFVTEYFKTVFLKIPLSVNKAGFCLEGNKYCISPLIQAPGD